MTTRKQAREIHPPSRWGRSPSGTYFYIIHTSKTDTRGRRLYRCRYLRWDVSSTKLWTMDELQQNRTRWLKNKPSRRQIADVLISAPRGKEMV